MSLYSKLIAAVVGNIVAFFLVWLAAKGLAVCTSLDGTQVCTIGGISNTQITALVMTLVNAGFVYFAPKNAA